MLPEEVRPFRGELLSCVLTRRLVILRNEQSGVTENIGSLFRQVWRRRIAGSLALQITRKCRAQLERKQHVTGWIQHPDTVPHRMKSLEKWKATQLRRKKLAAGIQDQSGDRSQPAKLPHGRLRKQRRRLLVQQAAKPCRSAFSLPPTRCCGGHLHSDHGLQVQYATASFRPLHSAEDSGNVHNSLNDYPTLASEAQTHIL